MHLFISWWIPQVPGLYFLLALPLSLPFPSVVAHGCLQLTVISCLSLLKCGNYRYESLLWSPGFLFSWKNRWVPPWHDAWHRAYFINMSSPRAARRESYFFILTVPHPETQTRVSSQGLPGLFLSHNGLNSSPPLNLHLPSIKGLASLLEYSMWCSWWKCHRSIAGQNVITFKQKLLQNPQHQVICWLRHKVKQLLSFFPCSPSDFLSLIWFYLFPVLFAWRKFLRAGIVV